jgi:orotate phosphoribosyltransferase
MDVLQELKDANAVYLGKHFVYKSGMHGEGYINMDPLFPNAYLIDRISDDLVEPFDGSFETIAAPAVGGIALLYACAYATASNWPAIVWADKNGDGFAFERAGFVNHLTGKRVLVVEDLLTTGGSVIKVIEQARNHGAEIVGVSVICNRGGVTAQQLGVDRLESLANVSFEAFDPSKCPLCVEGVPIIEDIGHGGKYKADFPTYKGGFTKLL